MRSVGTSAAVVFAISLLGCAMAGSGAASPTFPQHQGFGMTGPAATVAGTLVSADGCLMFEAATLGGQRTLLVWPSTYVPADGGDGVQGDGVVLRVGQDVVLAGGEYTDEAWVRDRLIGPPIKAECRTGRYALITSIVSSSS